ncbi:MAG TPA: hypothetical protein VH815_14690, partial [Acidobacteriota bacterium]
MAEIVRRFPNIQRTLIVRTFHNMFEQYQCVVIYGYKPHSTVHVRSKVPEAEVLHNSYQAIEALLQ